MEEVREFHGISFAAGDLRAAASVILAGLGVGGTTVVTGLEHLDRGYPDLAGQLALLGADIGRQAVVQLDDRDTLDQARVESRP